MKGDRACSKYKERRDYSHFQEIVDNVPYILMTLIGSAILLIGLDFSALGIVFALLYFLYGIAGTIWFIIFICPYCNFFGTRSCPCGYGQLAPFFRSKEDEEDFKGKFRRHIPVIVPLWIIPLVAGTIFLIMDLSITVLVLMVLFAIDSYVVLPLISRKYGCAHCPQKDTCPWMR
jgi:cell division protein FtsW (lipid II flippase)